MGDFRLMSVPTPLLSRSGADRTSASRDRHLPTLLSHELHRCVFVNLLRTGFAGECWIPPLWLSWRLSRPDINLHTRKPGEKGRVRRGGGSLANQSSGCIGLSEEPGLPMRRITSRTKVGHTMVDVSILGTHTAADRVRKDRKTPPSDLIPAYPS